MPKWTPIAAALTATLVASAAMAQTVAPKVEQARQGGVTETHVAGPGSWGEVTDQLARLLADPSRAAGVRAPTPGEVDELPPPLLLERGYRLLPLDRAQAHYFIALGKIRMRWDMLQCRDETVGGASEVIQRMFGRAALNLTPEPGDPTRAIEVGQKILAEGSAFTCKASPWWVCSQGLNAMQAALTGKVLAEDQWRLPPAERLERRQMLEAVYRQAFAKSAPSPAAAPAPATP